MTEQEEFEFRRRLEEEEEAAKSESDSSTTVPGELVNPLYSTIGGAILGEVAGPVVNKGTEAYKASKAARLAGETNVPAPTASTTPKTIQPQTMLNPKGVSVEQSVDNWRTYNEAQNEAAKKIRRDSALTKKYPNLTTSPSPAAQNLAAQKAQMAAEAAKNAPLSQKIAAKTPGMVKDLGAAGSAMMKSGVVPWLGRGIAGGSLGFEAADAYNRAKTGDTTGAIISGLGAIGSGASLIPTPLTRIVGTGLGLGAGALNAYRDRQREKEIEKVVSKASGGMIPGYAAGKAVKGGLEAAKKLFTPKPTKVVRASEALGSHEGKYLNLTQSDRMRSTDGDLGGPGFSKFQLERPEYAEAQAAWGVGNKPTASGIINVNKRYPEGKAIWSPMIGSEGQHRSNQHVYDALTDEFSRQASMGKLPPELREAMNKRLSGTPKYSALGLQEIDVANPEHIKNLGNTFDRRAAISEVIGGEGVGGRKGQIFDYPGVMQEMTDPMTIGSPTHSMGTRLFTLNNEIDYRPGLHSAFPYILKGEDMGVAFNPVPKELAFPSWINMAKEFTGREPGYMEMTRGIKGRGKPHQFIDEKYLRALEDAGHKEGGSTTPAWQRAEGKNPEGGLNAAGRASYNRETGGNLKAPQPQGGPRKDSFCARMEGMKKKNTSSATANDPDSRINKSLRKWKC